MRFNLIKNIRQFIADVKQTINDPYMCASEEGKQMWCEIEEWQKKQQNIADNSEITNQSSDNVT